MSHISIHERLRKGGRGTNNYHKYLSNASIPTVSVSFPEEQFREKKLRPRQTSGNPILMQNCYYLPGEAKMPIYIDLCNSMKEAYRHLTVEG